MFREKKNDNNNLSDSATTERIKLNKEKVLLSFHFSTTIYIVSCSVRKKKQKQKIK
jgi:hypothetical protein